MAAEVPSSVPAARASSGSRKEIPALIKEIESQVRVALSELLTRAGDELQILDKKPDLDPDGPMQDCEFGMILLQGSEWLREREAAGDRLSDENVNHAVRTLVLRSIERCLLPNPESEEGGGDPEGDFSRVFFSGAPYSEVKSGAQTTFCSNIDAVMMTVGFLAPAVRRLGTELHVSSGDWPVKLKRFRGEGLVPAWVNSPRDAAIFLVLAGSTYAQKCRVRSGSGFDGFECNPDVASSVAGDPSSSELADRLFFSWTACETIHDLVAWLPFVEEVRSDLPGEVVDQLRNSITDLGKTVADAASWSNRVFMTEFRKPSPVDVTEVVAEITGADKKLTTEQLNRIDQVKGFVQRAYGLSHCAAIRSLASGGLTLDDIAELCGLLDDLITKSILSSALDVSKHGRLWPTLTRIYKLRQPYCEYPDDAYYPLAVRSLSGLLARTIKEMGGSPRSERSKVVDQFWRVLGAHVENLNKRRPAAKEDSMLWTVAAGKEYYLYATQRSIFALLTYKDLLEAIKTFDEGGDSDRQLEDEIFAEFSKFLREAMAPTVKAIAAKLARPQAEVAQPALPAGTQPTQDKDPIDLRLPPWAAPAVRKWTNDKVEELAKEMEAEDTEKFIQFQAERLISYMKQAQKHRKGSGTIPKKAAAVFDTLKVYLGHRSEEFDSLSKDDVVLLLLELLLQKYPGEPVKDWREKAELSVELNRMSNRVDELSELANQKRSPA